MRNLVQVGTQVLTFSTYAIRQYCTMQGVSGQPEAIIVSLLKGELLTVPDIIKAGLEATSLHANIPHTAPDSLCYDLYEESADSGKVEEIMNAFIGSVVGKPTAEAGEHIEAYFAELAKDLEPKDDVKKKPMIRPSLAGKKSKTGPTKRG
jgi:hypothetical protein